MAFGFCGISEKQFYDLLPRQFTNLCDGIRDKNENSEKQSWERTRWQTWQLINIQLASKDKIRNPQRLIRFEWEEDQLVKDLKSKEAAFERLKKDLDIIDQKGNWKAIDGTS